MVKERWSEELCLSRRSSLALLIEPGSSSTVMLKSYTWFYRMVSFIAPFLISHLFSDDSHPSNRPNLPAEKNPISHSSFQLDSNTTTTTMWALQEAPWGACAQPKV